MADENAPKEHPENPGAKVKIIKIDRENIALDLKRQGGSYRKIARQMRKLPGISPKYSEGAAYKDIENAMKRLLSTQKELAETNLRMDIERLEEMFAEYYPRAVPQKEPGKSKPPPDILAANFVLSILDRRERLLNYKSLYFEAPKTADLSKATAAGPVLPHIPPEYLAKPYYDAYRDIINRKYVEYPFGNGRGTAKSTFVYGLMFPYLIINNPQVHGLILRQKEKDLRTSVYAQVCWGIRQLGLEHLFRFGLSPIQITYKPTGQKIFFSGADDPTSLKSIKPPFGYIGIAGFEELDQFRGEEAIRSILQSAMRGGDLAWIFKTWNTPRSIQNWVNQWILVPKDNRRPLEKYSYKDIPQEWLGSVFIDEAEHLLKVNPRAYEHEYGGVATGNGGMVFENLEERAITDEEIAGFERPRDGIDWGFFPDPFVWGRSHYDAARMTIYIYDELVLYKSSNKDAYDKLVEEKHLTKDPEIIADSASPKDISDFHNYGANIRGAEKGPDSVKYSYKWLQSRAKIVIDPIRCPVHAKEFRECEHEQTKDGTFIGEYPDLNNHTIDRTRYAHNLEWRKAGA